MTKKTKEYDELSENFKILNKLWTSYKTELIMFF